MQALLKFQYAHAGYIIFSVLLVLASFVRSGSNVLKVCSFDTCFTQSLVVLFHGQ